MLHLAHIYVGRDKMMEKGIGIHKDFDALGRIVIPKEMRSLFRFEKTVEVVVVEEGVLLRNPAYELVKKKANADKGE